MIRSMEPETQVINKEFVRKTVKAQKKTLTQTEIDLKSKSIIKRLLELEKYTIADKIYCYVNYNQEINMRLLFKKAWSDGKKVLVPRVFGEDMQFFYINSEDDLETGAYGIMEPKAYCKADEEFSGIMIIPGLGFDRKHHRIGYGGGFYDRYLNEHPKFYKVALAYDFQVFERIESEEFDVPVDFVISESEMF